MSRIEPGPPDNTKCENVTTRLRVNIDWYKFDV